VEGFRFSTQVTARFAETDSQGIVHNSVYLVWFEVARVAYLDEYAGGYPALRERGIEALVLEAHVRYVRPARFADRITIHARCSEVRGARFRYDYVLQRNGELVADGWSQHATVDGSTLRPTRVPDWLAEAISAAES
jgi:acyl-CoA thioester hydrolase